MEKHITVPLTEELAKTLHAGDTVYLTHEQIALEISSAREVVARQLKRWSNDGAVKLTRGRVTVLNRAYLEDFL